MTASEISTRTRVLAAVLEPVAGQVYFSPECHAAYAGLGFSGSSGELSGVAMPDGAAYFTSRGSVMGQVPGEVVAAAFGVFNPAVVVPAVTYGWTLTDATTIEAARAAGAVAQLRRVFGDEPTGVDQAGELLARAGDGLRVEGKSLFAGMMSQAVPDDPLGRAWRLADRLREYRGDAHIAAWTSAGLSAVEIGLLSELYWGLPMRTYIRTRAWSADELDAGVQSLEQRGYVADGAFTDAGRSAREGVETATDRQCEPIVRALGNDFGELIGILAPWAASIRDAGGYPASGPHDLARAAGAPST
jgi:hypothetical protein